MVIATDKEEVDPVVMKVTDGKGAHGAFDAVAGEMTGTLIRCLQESGIVLLYGEHYPLQMHDACRN